MSHRAILTFFMAMTILGVLVGCGQRKLVRLQTRVGCPWCGPNRQVQVGQRSMGKSFYGAIWREFWIDDAGQEYDPEKVGKDVWGYISTTRLAKSIDDAKQQGQACAQMQIVSVNPIIVLLYPSEHQRLNGVGQNLSMGTRHPQELAWTPNSAPDFAEPMQWLSPDLKAGPTDITFSVAGEAEIPLKTGKIKLVHTAGVCKITRE
jgi:hypothetical protein